RPAATVHLRSLPTRLSSDLRLLAAGATVVICGRTSPTDGALPDGVSFVAADVREPESVDALVAAVVDRHGRLDLAVNNAGGSPRSEEHTSELQSRENLVCRR